MPNNTKKLLPDIEEVNLNSYLVRILEDVDKIRFGQHLQFLNPQGYAYDPEGMCGGYNAMWIQADLCGEDFVFYDRYSEILRKNQSTHIIHTAALAKAREKLLSEIALLDQEDPANVAKLAKARIRLKSVEDKLKTLTDLRASFDELVIFQSPDLFSTENIDSNNTSNDVLFYGKQFNQVRDVDQISELISSIKLEQRGNIKLLAKLSREKQYTQNALINYLKYMQAYLAAIAIFSDNQNNNRQVPMSLDAKGHIVGLKFDVQKNVWILNDINHFPPDVFDANDYEALAEKIREYLAPNLDPAAPLFMRAKTYVTGDHGYIAVLEDNANALAALHQAGFDLNKPDQQGISLFQHALMMNKENAARALLQLGVELDQLDQNGNTVLHLAAQYSSEAVIWELLNLDFFAIELMDPKKNNKGETVLDILLSRNDLNLDITKLFTPLHVHQTIIANDITQIGKMIQRGLDVMQNNHLKFAIEHKKWSVVAVMLLYFNADQIPKDLHKALKKHRKELAEAIIQLIQNKQMKMDTQTFLGKLIRRENALGEVINPSKSSSIFSSKKYEGVSISKEMDKIIRTVSSSDNNNLLQLQKKS